MSQTVKVRCHRRGASLRPYTGGNKLNEGTRWQVQTLARLHKQRTSGAIQRVRLTERVLEVRNRQRQITQLQQKKEHRDTLCSWSGCVGEHVGGVRILVSQNTPSGLGFRKTTRDGETVRERDKQARGSGSVRKGGIVKNVPFSHNHEGRVPCSHTSEWRAREAPTEMGSAGVMPLQQPPHH